MFCCIFVASVIFLICRVDYEVDVSLTWCTSRIICCSSIFLYSLTKMYRVRTDAALVRQCLGPHSMMVEWPVCGVRIFLFLIILYIALTFWYWPLTSYDALSITTLASAQPSCGCRTRILGSCGMGSVAMYARTIDQRITPLPVYLGDISWPITWRVCDFELPSQPQALIRPCPSVLTLGNYSFLVIPWKVSTVSNSMTMQVFRVIS